MTKKLYSPLGGSRHLFTILVKDFHLFKIAESEFSFYLKPYKFKQVGVFYWNDGLHYLFTMKTF